MRVGWDVTRLDLSSQTLICPWGKGLRTGGAIYALSFQGIGGGVWAPALRSCVHCVRLALAGEMLISRALLVLFRMGR